MANLLQAIFDYRFPFDLLCLRIYRPQLDFSVNNLKLTKHCCTFAPRRRTLELSEHTYRYSECDACFTRLRFVANNRTATLGHMVNINCFFSVISLHLEARFFLVKITGRKKLILLQLIHNQNFHACYFHYRENDNISEKHINE
jgi:hypothetical protein